MGKAIKDIANPGMFLVLLVKGENSSEFIIPSGNTVLNKGDRLVLICNMEETHNVLAYFGDSNE